MRMVRRFLLDHGDPSRARVTPVMSRKLLRIARRNDRNESGARLSRTEIASLLRSMAK
jgi:hypothetical protein